MQFVGHTIIEGDNYTLDANHASLKLMHTSGTIKVYDWEHMAYLAMEDVDKERDKASLVIGGMKMGSFSYSKLHKMFTVNLT